METSIQEVNTVPEYIKNFIDNNLNHLEEIYKGGMEQNNNEGALYMQCKVSTNEMDVTFVDKQMAKQIITDKKWDDLKETRGVKKVFLINDFDINSLFIIYL
tara:strand:- start:1509 stop:1814 length:306 start_codon:yes stop_codon:yes gene_type:complete